MAEPDGTLQFPVAIDGRTNVTPHDIMAKFLHAFRGLVDWHDYLDVTAPKTILWKLESPLSALLIESPEWCEVFRDGDVEVGHIVFVERKEYERNFSELPSPDCPTPQA